MNIHHFCHKNTFYNQFVPFIYVYNFFNSCPILKLGFIIIFGTLLQSIMYSSFRTCDAASEFKVTITKYFCLLLASGRVPTYLIYLWIYPLSFLTSLFLLFLMFPNWPWPSFAGRFWVFFPSLVFSVWWAEGGGSVQSLMLTDYLH